MKIKAFFLVLTYLFAISISNAQKTTLVNPVLTGFYPDPSIVKVGADYYSVHSTFSYFPGLPIMHSRDLKNWKQIGNVINRPQMDFMGERMSRGLFALLLLIIKAFTTSLVPILTTMETLWLPPPILLTLQ
jgi:alpha-N-arabinofuranosidase